tara:strand:- start:4104 stop:4253 length:150 start_codon:yes stop_codon:yes gene_type:complete
MVTYPKKYIVSELKKLSIEELEELEDALYYDRERVMNVLRYKRMESEEE